MNIVCLIFGVLFLVSGLAFAYGKVHVHLRDWKRMPEQEKAKILIKPLCMNIGSMISLCGLIFLLGGLSKVFKDSVFDIAMVLWMVGVAFDVCYITKSQRYIRTDLST